MPRIIFTSRYLSQAPIAQLANLVEYMGTRPGVELCPAGWPDLPATEKQQRLITRLRGELPDVATLPEYAEYQQQPNRESASNFISTVVEQYADQIVGRGELVRYMGMRPGVEKRAAHGLFSQTDEPRSLNEIVNEVASHPGIVWSHVLSLRREDAARLSYDNQAAYKTLLRNSLSLLAGAHKIAPANLRWVAAYHDEDSHPHVHLLVYSSDPAEGYLTNTGIERMRGGFAKIIFQDTLRQLYDKQTDAHDLLREQAGRLLKDLADRIDAGDCADEQLETMLTQLRDRLQDVSGKRVYQYLPPDAKRLVNTAVDRLADNDQIAALYKIWQEQRKAILETYTDTGLESQPLSSRKEFRPVLNMVIRAALSLSSHAPMKEPESGWDEDSGWPDGLDSADMPASAFSLYSMAAEHEKRPNAYAMYELGGMYRDGRGTERDAAKSERWYSAAYTRFVAMEQERGDGDLAYRLARMNLSGTGTPVNFELAKAYLEKAAVLKNVNAYYGLGTLYLKKEYEGCDPQRAAFWFAKAADEGHDFAEYSLGKLYLKGESVPKDTARAITYLERSAAQKNQYAEYTLGKLYLFGMDVPEDRERALYWLHRSAAQGNQYAARLLEQSLHPPVNPHTAVLGLLQGLARLLDSQTESQRLAAIHTDSKLLAEMAEKRAALGYREGQKRPLRL